MSNKFGEFYYHPADDKDGFGIAIGQGVHYKLLSWEPTQERAIMDCQRRYIASLIASLESPATYAEMKSALRHCLDMMKHTLNGLNQFPSTQTYVQEMIEMYEPLIAELCKVKDEG